MVAFGRKEAGVTDLAQDLAFGTIILVKVNGGRIAARAGTVLGDIAFLPAFDWLKVIAVAFAVIGKEIFPVPVLCIRLDPWKFIDFEFLVLRGMGIIEGPLF